MLPCFREKRKKLPPIEIFPNGREVCNMASAEGRRTYRSRTLDMWRRQDQICAFCSLWMYKPTFDHEQGRTVGKQDDRIEVNGKWKNAAICEHCNILKGSRRFKWIDGFYREVKRVREVA